MFKDYKIKDFLNQTASNEPTPGGGSIAALTGAIAFSLCEMVANLSLNKEKYAIHKKDFENIIKVTEDLREELLDDINKDASSFDEVMKAFKLPKSTDEEKKVRSAKIQEGYKYAASVPMGIAEKIFKSLEVIEFVINNGNQNALTDGLVSLMSARTAILGALLNVKINLGSIKDKEFVEECNKKVNALETKTIDFEQRVLTKINL
ncbi:cyclodeaminase/cyclohydrolase family protein [Mycoplasmatota bacterium]|nr:cyclodeaminase/cyclohydrolase family protein [Mycoplasmatota bacterium]